MQKKIKWIRNIVLFVWHVYMVKRFFKYKLLALLTLYKVEYNSVYSVVEN